MTNPLVSIVVPTYNRGSLLIGAVTSAMEQSYRPVEILVADDGSTDDTENRVRSIGDPVRYVRLPHSGRPSVTRNRALAKTRGDYVAFLDDDDQWSSEKLSTQMEIMQREPEIGLVFTNGRYAFPDGRLSEPMFSPPKHRGNMFQGLLRDCFIHPSTALVRRATLDASGWFDEQLTIAEDLDLWLRIARITDMVFLDRPLVTITKHTRQISTEREHETWENMLRILHRVRLEPGLTVSNRIRARRTLAKTHNRLAAFTDGTTAAGHYMKAVRWNPLSRTAWRGLMRFVFTRT